MALPKDWTGHGAVIANADVTPDSADLTDFGTVELGLAVKHRFVISDSGGLWLHLSGAPRIEILGDAASDFRVTARPASGVSPNGYTEFEIKFTPHAIGLRTAMVRIANDDPNAGSFEFAIQGNGVVLTPAEISVIGNGQSIENGKGVPALADGTEFVPVHLGYHSTSHFEIVNDGQKRLSLTGSPRVETVGANAGDFRVTARPSVGISANERTSFDITFRPQTIGLRTSTVRVHNNDSDEGTFEFAIQGTGWPTWVQRHR